MRLLLLALVASCAHSSEPDTLDSTPPSIGSDAGGLPAHGPDARPSPPARCDPNGEGRLLECSSGCPDTLFSNLRFEENFGPSTVLSTDWDVIFAAPTITGRGLQFGPHPLP